MRRYKEQEYKGEFNLKQAERNLIVKTLKICKGKKSTTALCLQIPEKSLYTKLYQHKIMQTEYLN